MTEQAITCSASVLAADCKTAISPHVDVDSEATLRRLLRCAGAKDSAIAEYESNLRCSGRGSVWIDDVTGRGREVGAARRWIELLAIAEWHHVAFTDYAAITNEHTATAVNAATCPTGVAKQFGLLRQP